MVQYGTRLLSLDGGGTRGLSALYILRELMNGVVPGHGGSVRPCEYFELIGGTGLNGLCALLFARFCYTVNEAIDFFHDISGKLDGIVSFRDKVLSGDVEKDLQDWVGCMSDYNDPKEQLEALRQGTVQDCWSALIEKNVSDGLERYEHMVDGKFDFKGVDGKIEAGRSKAFVVSSESQGYGNSGSVSVDHQYHVPTLHRTYECRHGKSTYTLYAIGLGTVASPSIMKPGVIFPDFLATGKHSQHNPVCLVLEESRKLWPGLPVSSLISIGTGTFDLERSCLKSLMVDTAKVCFQIAERNRNLSDDIERFVLPFDKKLATAYCRFDNPLVNTFLEHPQKDRILGDVKSWLEAPVPAARIAMASRILKTNRFPNSPEDMVALASLASLLRALNVAGYARESLTISDILANYILYESDVDSDGSFRKLCVAAKAELLSSSILSRQKVYTQGSEYPIPEDPRSEAAVLNGLGAFGDQLPGGYRRPGPPQTIFDYVSAAYYCLTLLRERGALQLDQPTFAMHFQELCFVSELPQISNSTVVEKMEELLRLTTVAALCDAAAVQLLRGVRSLSYSGAFIRHVHDVLLTVPIRRNSKIIIDPIASLLALLMETKNWSPTRDSAISALLKAGAPGNDNWSLVNLAMSRLQMASSIESNSPDSNNTLSKCAAFVNMHAKVWQTKALEMIVPCVQNGWFPLIRKSLCAEELISDAHLSGSADIMRQAETGFRSAAQAGYPYVLKKMLECLGINFCKRLANQPNEQGLTAVHLACKHRAPKEVFRLFHILVSDVNSKCHSGRTPLSYCFPDQKALPSLYQSTLDLISELFLPTTAPLDKPKAYGGHRNGRSIDPRTADFRIIIDHLVSRNADISIQDHNGMTPLHIAAKEGWGDNLDVFFIHRHGNLNRLQTQCLTIRDYSEYTVLDYSRMAGDRGVIQGREDVIAAEMTKHAIPVPPKIVNTVPVHDIYMSMPMGRPRLPTPEPAANLSCRPPPRSEHRPANTPSPQPYAPRFPPPIVYHDPSIESNRNLDTPSPHPTFPVSQAHQDPNFSPYVPRDISPTLTPTRPQFSPAQISHDQRPHPPGPSANYRQ
ncbi:hypothetical protein BGZ57DRAFT_959493 [Hyaloscypha finlandica]|nr:hypothetical protein BGZ57DRAFT_959493 [Hyaloscypha finlandica]